MIKIPNYRSPTYRKSAAALVPTLCMNPVSKEETNSSSQSSLKRSYSLKPNFGKTQDLVSIKKCSLGSFKTLRGRLSSKQLKRQTIFNSEVQYLSVSNEREDNFMEEEMKRQEQRKKKTEREQAQKNEVKKILTLEPAASFEHLSKNLEYIEPFKKRIITLRKGKIEELYDSDDQNSCKISESELEFLNRAARQQRLKDAFKDSDNSSVSQEEVQPKASASQFKKQYKKAASATYAKLSPRNKEKKAQFGEQNGTPFIQRSESESLLRKEGFNLKLQNLSQKINFFQSKNCLSQRFKAEGTTAAQKRVESSHAVKQQSLSARKPFSYSFFQDLKMKFASNKFPCKSPKNSNYEKSPKYSTLKQRKLNESHYQNYDLYTPMSQGNSSPYYNFSNAIRSPRAGVQTKRKSLNKQGNTGQKEEWQGKLIKLKELNQNQGYQKKQESHNAARSRNIPIILELKTQNLQRISKSRRASYQLQHLMNRDLNNGEKRPESKSQTQKGAYFDQIKLSLKTKIEEKQEFKIDSLIRKAWKNDCYYVAKNERKIHKKDLEVSDEKKFTPLHIAVKCGYFQFARLLLKLGADPNVQNIEGNTPLHLAFMDHKLEMAKLLLRYHAQPGILNVYNKSSIYYLDRESLIINFPQLLSIPFSREVIGNCAIEKRVPSIITSNLNGYCPLYSTDSPTKVYQSKISYFDKIFKTFKKITDSTGS